MRSPLCPSAGAGGLLSCPGLIPGFPGLQAPGTPVPGPKWLGRGRPWWHPCSGWPHAAPPHDCEQISPTHMVSVQTQWLVQTPQITAWGRGRSFLFTFKKWFSFSFHRVSFVIFWCTLCPGWTTTNSGTTPVWRLECIGAKIFDDAKCALSIRLLKGLIPSQQEPLTLAHTYIHACALTMHAYTDTFTHMQSHTPHSCTHSYAHTLTLTHEHVQWPLGGWYNLNRRLFTLWKKLSFSTLACISEACCDSGTSWPLAWACRSSVYSPHSLTYTSLWVWLGSPSSLVQ